VTDHDTVVPERGPSGGGDGNLWQRLRLEKRKGVLIGIVALVAVIVLIVIATRHSTSDSKNGNDAAKGTHVVAGQTAVVNGVSWHAVKGDWNVAPNSTIVAKAGNLALSMLVTRASSPNATVQAKMPVVATGSGLVFRYKSPFDYWSIQAAREVASWRVIKVVGGKSTVVGNTGLSPTEPDTVVGVSTRTDGLLGVSFNGKLKVTFSDKALADQKGAGMIASGVKSSSAVFSGFDVSGSLPPP